MFKLLTQTVKENRKYFFFLTLGLVIAIILTYFFIKNKTENYRNINPTDSLISQSEQAVNFDKNNTSAIINLANLYFQKSRETADTSYYSKIENLFKQHENKLKDNFAVPYLLSQIANARHDFVLGEKLSLDAIKLAPKNSKVYGPLVDAQVEQGRYKEAELSLQKMINIRPDFASLTRVAYFREIHGDIQGAIKSLEEAGSAGAPFAENRAWLLTELGKLYFRSDLNKAQESFNLAINIVPNYTPALEWLARIELAKGNIDIALQKIDRALEILPIAQYATLKYKIAKLNNDEKLAAQMSILTQLTYANSQKNGTNVDMELAYFLADNDIDNKKALELAQRAYQTRKSIYGADTLALAYFKNGNHKEALKYIKEALKIGENDAMIVKHASEIYKAMGDEKESARLSDVAKKINPNFVF